MAQVNREQVLAAVGLPALAELGCTQIVPGFPQARFGNGIVFVQASALPAVQCGAVWKNAFPGAAAPDNSIAPLLDPARALKMGLHWVRIKAGADVSVAQNGRFDGKYYITGVTHKYTHSAGGSTGYTSTLRRSGRHPLP